LTAAEGVVGVPIAAAVAGVAGVIDLVVVGRLGGFAEAEVAGSARAELPLVRAPDRWVVHAVADVDQQGGFVVRLEVLLEIGLDGVIRAVAVLVDDVDVIHGDGHPGAVVLRDDDIFRAQVAVDATAGGAAGSVGKVDLDTARCVVLVGIVVVGVVVDE
jgi:hypothetical protein